MPELRCGGRSRENDGRKYNGGERDVAPWAAFPSKNPRLAHLGKEIHAPPTQAGARPPQGRSAEAGPAVMQASTRTDAHHPEHLDVQTY